MKILNIFNDDTFAYNFKKDLLRSMVLAGNDVYVVLPIENKKEELLELGVKLVNVAIDRRGMNLLKDLKLKKQISKIIREIKPDAINTYTIKCNIYGGLAAKKAKLPYYANVTGLGSSFQGGIITKVVTLLNKIALKGVKKVFFENLGNLNVFTSKNIIPQEKAVLVNGSGVDLKEFSICPMKNEKVINFLYMGRIMKEKGIEELFYAAKKIREKTKDVTFTFIGNFEDDYKKKFDELQKAEIIDYKGYQDDVKEFIKNSSCVVLPSYHEGMSNTLLEGAAMGRPLITSNIHGCKEAVINQESGFLVKVKDKEDLLEKLEKFILLPFETRQEMGQISRKHMEENFDKTVVNQKVLDHILSPFDK